RSSSTNNSSSYSPPRLSAAQIAPCRSQACCRNNPVCHAGETQARAGRKFVCSSTRVGLARAVSTTDQSSDREPLCESSRSLFLSVYGRRHTESHFRTVQVEHRMMDNGAELESAAIDGRDGGRKPAGFGHG